MRIFHTKEQISSGYVVTKTDYDIVMIQTQIRIFTVINKNIGSNILTHKTRIMFFDLNALHKLR
jgi:hypothetical protein